MLCCPDDTGHRDVTSFEARDFKNGTGNVPTSKDFFFQQNSECVFFLAE